MKNKLGKLLTAVTVAAAGYKIAKSTARQSLSGAFYYAKRATANAVALFVF